MRSVASRGVVLLSLAALGMTGCDDPPVSREATPRRSAATTTTTAPAGKGVVRGTVTFKGTAPGVEAIPGTRCHGSAAATTVAPVVVSDRGVLKDVMVYVKDAGPVDAGSVQVGMDPPIVLDQVNCQFVPHVVGLRTGQVLKVTSSDPTLHNVHTLCVDNPAVNFGMTGAGQSRDLRFDVPERFEVKCDVHPWMKAHVYVFGHPYFAATDRDGRYEIGGLPPGDHTLVFSHPFLGEREAKVTVSDGAAAEAGVTFERGGR